MWFQEQRRRSRTPPEPRPRYMPFATADRIALADAWGAARLFVGAREWRLRSPSEAQFIDVPLPGKDYAAHACRIIDLSDGSCLAYANLRDHDIVILRLLESELEPLPEPAPDDIRMLDQATHRSRQALDFVDW